MTHLPGALVSAEDIAVVVGIVAGTPGISFDALRIGAGLRPDRLEHVLLAATSRGLIRRGRRGDGNNARARLYPTHLASPHLRRVRRTGAAEPAAGGEAS